MAVPLVLNEDTSNLAIFGTKTITAEHSLGLREHVVVGSGEFNRGNKGVSEWKPDMVMGEIYLSVDPRTHQKQW